MATSTARKPRQRYLLLDGSAVPSVTTVLGLIDKPAVPAWANKLGRAGIMYREHLDSLADIGSCAHALIAGDLTGRRPDVSDYTSDQLRVARTVLDTFHLWTRDKDIETLGTEMALTSQRLRFGGTCDFYGRINGVPTLIDWKTSSAVYPDHLYQASAYRQLLVEAGYEVEEMRVVALPRDEGAEFSEKVIPASEIEPYFAVFRAALELHRVIAATKPAKGRRW